MKKRVSASQIKKQLNESLKKAGERWKIRNGKKNLNGFKKSSVFKALNTRYNNKAAVLTGKDLKGNPMIVKPSFSGFSDYRRFKNKTDAVNYYNERERLAAEKWKKKNGKKNLRGFTKSIAYIGINNYRNKAVDFFDSKKKRTDNVLVVIKKQPHFTNLSSGGSIMEDLFQKQGMFGDKMDIVIESSIQGHEFTYKFDSYSAFMLNYPSIYEFIDNIKEESGYYPQASYKFFDRGVDNYANILIQ